LEVAGVAVGGPQEQVREVGREDVAVEAELHAADLEAALGIRVGAAVLRVAAVVESEAGHELELGVQDVIAGLVLDDELALVVAGGDAAGLEHGGVAAALGVAVGWDDGPDGSPFRAEVAYTDGANAINQNFQDFPTTKANFGLAGRVEYMAFGKWSEYEDFTTIGNTQDMLAFGAGADITEAGDTDTLLHTVDVHYETGKLGLFGAYLGRSIEDATVGTGASAANHNGYDWGFIVQAAYLMDKHLEPFVRYDFINFDKDLLPAGTDENQVHEFTAGVNYYFKGHNAKFTADVTYLPNGTPVADTGGDILASDDETEFVIRAQFQLLL
jgi:hypothetical protein